jgi:hypothetical protein
MSGIIIFLVIIAAVVIYMVASSSPGAVARREDAAARQAKVICPHCQQAGGVSRRLVRRKRGISGGKAAGAVLTGGVSMLATGLSRKEDVTNLSCSNCGMSWDV